MVFAWEGADGERWLVVVNYAPNQSQCYVRLPFAGPGIGRWRLKDLIGAATHERAGDELATRGLYLDEPPWRAQVFSLTDISQARSQVSSPAGN